MTAGDWITKPRWQAVTGLFIVFCILAAGIVPLLAIQSEKNHRQDEATKESVVRIFEIKAESARVTCGILKGFNRLTPQVSLFGVTDQPTIDRFTKINADRLAARAILRASMPTDIVKKCPIEVSP